MSETPAPLRNASIGEAVTELEHEISSFTKYFKDKKGGIVTNPFFGDLNYDALELRFGLPPVIETTVNPDGTTLTVWDAAVDAKEGKGFAEPLPDPRIRGCTPGARQGRSLP